MTDSVGVRGPWGKTAWPAFKSVRTRMRTSRRNRTGPEQSTDGVARAELEGISRSDHCGRPPLIDDVLRKAANAGAKHHEAFEPPANIGDDLGKLVQDGATQRATVRAKAIEAAVVGWAEQARVTVEEWLRTYGYAVENHLEGLHGDVHGEAG